MEVNRHRTDLVTSFVMIACLALAGPFRDELGYVPLAVYVLGLLVGLMIRGPQSIHVGIVAMLMAGLHLAIGQYWPATSVVLLLVYGGLVMKSPFLRESCGWWQRGHASKTDVLLTAGFIVTSAVALIVWSLTTTADLTEFSKFVPDLPKAVIISGLFFYACLNALYEEVIWRGVVTQALERGTQPTWTALALQSVAFGLWHFVGFPSGWIGVGLAAIFAFMMGLLRLRTNGLLTPFVAHVAADITIYVIVAIFVL